MQARDEWRKTYRIAIELNEKTALLLDRKAQDWQKRYSLVKAELPLDKIREMRAAVENDLTGLGQNPCSQQRFSRKKHHQLDAVGPENTYQHHGGGRLRIACENRKGEIDPGCAAGGKGVEKAKTVRPFQ